MAKRITKLFQKNSQGKFDSENPIRIGSSAQYITVSESEIETLEDDEKEFLKERLDVIGNPDDLTVNNNIGRDNQNYNTITTYLNNIGPKANSMWNSFDGKLNTSGGAMSGNIVFNSGNIILTTSTNDIIFDDNFKATMQDKLGIIFDEEETTTP